MPIWFFFSCILRVFTPDQKWLHIDMTSWGSTSCHSWPQNLSSYLWPVSNSFAPMSVMTLSYRLPCCNSWARQFLEKEIVQENCLSGLQWFFFMFYEFCSFIWVKWCNWKNNGKEETTELSYWKTVKLNNFANLVWTNLMQVL